jgi:steroid 5-alpha reductase family enzyme
MGRQMVMSMVITVRVVFIGMGVFQHREIVLLHLLLDYSLRMEVWIDQRGRTAGECIDWYLLELRLGRSASWDICNLL